MAKAPEPTKALIAAMLKEEDQDGRSPAGLRATAAGLRQRASRMADSNDQQTMLRIAAGYEHRAGMRYGT